MVEGSRREVWEVIQDPVIPSRGIKSILLEHREALGGLQESDFSRLAFILNDAMIVAEGPCIL